MKRFGRTGASLSIALSSLAGAQPATHDPIDTVVVTARLRQEDAQSVPISLSAVSGETLDDTFTLNLQQITQLVPSLNYSSPNPRNTAFTIRGLGSSVVAIAQANDGLEPGVGFYVDQVYHARPATAAFDFLDLERVEVLRGPQGTLFGKNTTAGAISLTTEAPTFDTAMKVEASGGNFGYVQSRASLNGTLIDGLLAGRLSGSIAERDGVLKNVTTGGRNNDMQNAAIRGQLLFQPAESLSLRMIGDYASIDSNCCTQVFVRVGTSLKNPLRQYPAMAAALGYAPPSVDPYDRLTDIDSALEIHSREGGGSAILDWNLGPVTLTSVSAWRFWDWSAANDRDYTSLSIQTIQGIPSHQDQWSQELRLASNGTNTIDYVAGLYGFSQVIRGNPVTAYGPRATYWLLGPATQYPQNLLDGYRTDGHTRFESNSYAAFGEATWHVTSRLDLTGGVRYTYEDKNGSYDATVSGGLATTDLALVNAKLSILRAQSYFAEVSDDSPSGRVTVSYRLTPQVMPYLTVAKGSKSGGINMSGLPLNALNQPALSAAAIKPEKNTTYELGTKARFLDGRLTLNVDLYQTDVADFQANVVDTGPGALRGYLANIEKVRVRGAEMDATWAIGRRLSAYLSAAYTDGTYESYRNAPCPLELIPNTGTPVCDLSGKPLSNLPKWVASVGGEYTQGLRFADIEAEGYLRLDFSSRTRYYADATDSQFTQISGYGLLNASIGLRDAGPVDVFAWARNLLDKNYIQNLTVQAGNSGLVVGTPGDARTYGVTARVKF